jgi:tight adherence protein B
VSCVLLALRFAAGVGLIWLGTVGGFSVRVEMGILRDRLGGIGMWALRVFLAVVVGWLAFVLVRVPILALAAAFAGGYLPALWRRRGREGARRERERAWPAALAQLADALEAGLAFPAAVVLVAEAGPPLLRSELARFHARLRAGGLEAALDGLAEAGERSADTVALLLRAGLLELPSGGLAPMLRELSVVLGERFEAREKARSRAASLQVEAAVLALSPIVLLLLVGVASPAYLDAYRTPAGTVVGALGGGLIFGCYLLMRRLGRVPEPRRTQGRGGP